MQWWAVGALMCGLGGCAGGLLDAARVEQAEEAAREQAESDKPELDHLVTRGRFDLSCPDVSATVLERHSDGPITLVGVAGCDRRVQYNRRLRSSFGGRTTKNTHWDKVHEPSVVARIESR